MIALLLACAPTLLEATLEPDASGVLVRANQPVDRVWVRDAQGLVLESAPGRATFPLRLPERPLSIELKAGTQRWRVEHEPEVVGPVVVWLEAPVGQRHHGGVVPLPDGRPVPAVLAIEARRAGPVLWSIGAIEGRAELVEGERRTVAFEVDGTLGGWVEADGVRTPIAVQAQPVPASQLARQVELDLAFPVDAEGERDPTVPDARIVLPARWWEGVLDRFRLGYRARDDQQPRGLLGAELVNRGDVPLTVLVRARAVGPGSEAFQPRLRDALHLDEVVRWVVLPAGETTHVGLPVYLDSATVRSTRVQRFEVRAELVGSGLPLAADTLDLVIERGSRWASLTVIGGLIAALFGWSMLGIRLRSWLERPTGELATIAMFGAAAFTVGAASQIGGLGLATVLGPFAPFVLGLFDDALRLSLTAALVSLIPRVGVATVALLVGWCMRAVVLGAVHPIDALYLGAAVTLSECALWIAGLTRGRPGRSRLERWGRLSLGLAVPHAAGSLLALGVSSVLYRLYYDELYVAAIVLLPGFVYAVVGCALAVGFVERLR